MNGEKVFKLTFARVYPFYGNKVERKGRNKTEVNETMHRIILGNH
jgi:hypothetical protein